MKQTLTLICFICMSSPLLAGGLDAPAGTYAVLHHQIKHDSTQDFVFIHGNEAFNQRRLSFSEISKLFKLEWKQNQGIHSLVQHALNNKWKLVSVSSTPPFEKGKGIKTFQKTSYHFVKE